MNAKIIKEYSLFKILLITFNILLLYSIVFSQIDSLFLQELNSVDVPDDITSIYQEDLNNDLYDELIACTHGQIFIFDGQSNELTWSSPDLIAPHDLLFSDINNDGLIDISVIDSLNIFLFDIFNSAIIWISPILDSTYVCYSISDRNDDDWVDVLIVSKEPFYRIEDEYNYDTVWVDIYDGPAFQQYNSFFIPMRNARYDNGLRTITEIPTSIAVERFIGPGGSNTVIQIYTSTYYGINYGVDIHYVYYSGNVWHINNNDFIYHCIPDIGNLIFYEAIDNNDSLFIYALGDKYEYDSSPWHYYGIRSKIINQLSSDTVISSILLWEHNVWEWPNYGETNWNGFVSGEIIESNQGSEIFWAYQDGLYLYDFPESNEIWEISNEDEIESVEFLFRSPALYDSPHIICKTDNLSNSYQFIDGLDGSLDAVLICHDIEISDIADLDNDTNDELLSINGNTIFVYRVEFIVGIDNSSEFLPQAITLYQNYPNPFNAATTISYDLPQPGMVTLDIYDILGRKVETLINKHQPAGYHQAIWNADGFSSGTYFYKLIAGEHEHSKKMILIK